MFTYEFVVITKPEPFAVTTYICSTSFYPLLVSCGFFRSQRAAKEAKEAPAQPAPEKPRVDIKRFVKIGRPGYKVTKQRDPDSGQQSLLFQVQFIV